MLFTQLGSGSRSSTSRAIDYSIQLRKHGLWGFVRSTYIIRFDPYFVLHVQIISSMFDLRIQSGYLLFATFYFGLANLCNGSVNRIRARYSKTTANNGSESSLDDGHRQTSPTLKEKIGKYSYGQIDVTNKYKIQSSSSSDIPILMDLNKQKVIKDHFMEEYGYVRLVAELWDFESNEDVALQNTAIFTEVTITQVESLKNKQKLKHSQLASESYSSISFSQGNPLAQIKLVKRKYEIEVQKEQLEKQLLSLLSGQYYAEKSRLAQFNTIEDMKIAYDIKATFEENEKVDIDRADLLNYQINLIKRDKFFQESSWGGANVIFIVTLIEPAQSKEKKSLAKIAIESAVAVDQGVGVWEASLVSAVDTQSECESRLKRVYQGAQTEVELCQNQKDRYKKKGGFDRFNLGIIKVNQQMRTFDLQVLVSGQLALPQKDSIIDRTNQAIQKIIFEHVQVSGQKTLLLNLQT
ncbi:MAG: hypothetical protein EZS28_020682 [Streblomastix strix]|uniref:Uncharacterized protein n=1 Tax=Streblomastix strix TaxID=222440 RepID=A0A5J4VMD8_9EUKA|nr:MAG: hypothetical protein EZS28_020682 [Streblomastix strix]